MADLRDTDTDLSATVAADTPASALLVTQLVAADAPALLATQVATPATLTAHAGPLHQIARFAVLRELGRGAMGVVYAGYDEELDRRVAIKLVDLGDSTRTSHGQNQLLREAQALARLTHPNVVAVFEAGVHDGRVYLAMEYVHGVDLQQWLAQGPRAWREVVATFLQAGAGLLAAHKVGLIHRDFKPSNVLVGDDGRVRVADFGLATQRSGALTDAPVPQDMDPTRSPGARSQRLATTIAGAGALLGTPAYMAPEMFAHEPASAATDQFAFCVALFEALYGRLPFAADSLVELVYQVLHAELPAAPPDPRVPAWLHALVLRGLARDPAQRFPDLGALLVELARDPEGERQRRRTRRRQLIAAVVLTLLVVVGGVAIYRGVVRDAHERRAEARLEVLRKELSELRNAGRDDEAAQLFASFTALADNRSTAALGRAYREWGEAQADPDAAIDALAAGYVHARTRDDRLSSLRGLTLRLAARGDADGAAVALATLDAQAPELVADPELRELRLATALTRRDFPAALAALADPESSAAHILSRLSRATQPPIDLASRPDDPLLSLADLDSDGRPEVLTRAPGQGDGVVQVLRGDATLARLSELQLPELIRPDGVHVPVNLTRPPYLLPGFGGAPRLLVTGKNPGNNPNGQWILAILPLTPGAAPELVWTDSRTFPAVGDLDRDGAPELYLATSTYSRHLRRLTRDPAGTWQQQAPHPRTDAAHSDFSALALADLDDDGVPELIAALAGWNAYDLRVFRDDGHGGLTLVTRKTLGAVKSLSPVRADGRVRLAAIKSSDYPSERRFPAGDHTGPPAGLYVLELVQGTLETVQFVPARADEQWGLATAADLDGDARDELIAGDKRQQSLVVFPRDEHSFREPLRIGGGMPRLVANLDEDPEAEIVVHTTDGHTLVLGAGDTPTPALPRDLPEARPIREDLDDPAITEAWRHAEDLATLGLPGRAADELVAMSRLSRHVQADMLLRAGQLYAAAGKHALAAAQFTAAAARPDLAESALTGAIQGHVALRELAAAAALAEARAALPGQPAAAKADAEALHRAATVGPALSLRFDRPLDPGWRIYDPLAVTRDPGTQTLSLQTSSERVLAELPLEWDGGSVELSVDFSLEHLDWDTLLEVSVGLPDDDNSWLAVALRSGGSTALPERQASVDWGPRSETWVLHHELPRGFTGRVRIHFRHDVELGLALAEVTPASLPSIRETLPGREIKAPQAPPRGPLRLRVSSRTHNAALVGRVRVHAIDLTGFRPGTWPTAPDPDTQTARLIAEGELGPALARLPIASEGIRGLWRAHLLARLGDDDAAAEALTLALRGTADFTLADLQLNLGEGEEAAPRARFRQLVLHEPDEFHRVARRVLGPALNEVYATSLLQRQALRPELLRHRLLDLEPQPLAPPTTRDPLVNRRHCEGLILRGTAWRAAGRGDLARRDLEAAWQTLDDDTREFPHRDQLRSDVGQRLLELAVAAGDTLAARRWLTIQLADSKMPEITLDIWRAQPDLQALLDADAWAELLATADKAP